MLIIKNYCFKTFFTQFLMIKKYNFYITHKGVFINFFLRHYKKIVFLSRKKNWFKNL